MAFELPIFPLNVVLFPGMSLPLHVFEPRYRLMISRCLEEERKFGVALIREGEEGHDDTLPAWVGTVAEITATLPFPDGRMNIQTVGLRRYRIIALREEDDYLVGKVDWLDDAKINDGAAALAKKVRAVLRRYLTLLARNTKSGNLELESLNLPHDPEQLSMAVAMLLTLPNEQKQELLEITSTAARLSHEHTLLKRAEVTQLAFARRAQSPPPDPATDTLGEAGKYVSWN